MKSLSNFLQININEKAITSVIFASFLLFFASCAKDYYPKQFPPVQSCPDLPVVTYGGEDYPTVLIDGRCWMAKNMNIGIMISDSTDMTDNNVIEKYCYDNDTVNCTVFGGLYQWDEVMQYKTEEGSQGICPEGWHIPTNRDFVDLVIYHENCSEYLMDNRDTLWAEFGQSENFNLTGFSVLPAGCQDEYSFSLLYYYTFFWGSKEISDWGALCLRFYGDGMIIGWSLGKKDGLSIRCIKDE
jgi:uncharacterized protein (TIGR02145 family)